MSACRAIGGSAAVGEGTGRASAAIRPMFRPTCLGW